MCDFSDITFKTKSNKKCTKKYNNAWENYTDFKEWISSSKKGERCFYCKLCNRDYVGGINAVKLHSIIHRPVEDEPIKRTVVELTEGNFNKVAGK